MTSEELEEGRDLVDSCVRDGSGWDSQVKSSYAAEQWLKRHASELLSLAEEARWRSVVEEPPPTDREFIGYDKFYNRVGEAERDGNQTNDFGEPSCDFIDSDDCHITHWKPLPKPPVAR